MKVELQGPNECMLATIAALADVPLATVRARALRLTGGASWYVVASYYPRLYWAAARWLAEEYGVVAAVALKPLVAGAHPPRRWRRLPAGRGSIIFRFGKRYHICPFADGLIYDPMTPETPQTLAEYRQRYPRCRVVTVQAEAKAEPAIGWETTT